MLGQAQAVEKANEVLPTPDTFWTSASVISHFYVSSSSQPPNSNLVYTLVGEGDEQSSGSLQQVGWMLDTFSKIRDDPSQSMGGLTPFIFKPELLQCFCRSAYDSPGPCEYGFATDAYQCSDTTSDEPSTGYYAVCRHAV